MRLVLAALALMAIASPAMAAAPESIACVETRLGSDSMARIGAQVIAALDAGKSLDTSLDMDRDAVIAARNACRDANKWSSQATDTALSYAKAGAALIGGEAAVRADGLDPAALKARYAALVAEDRRSLSAAPMTSPALAAITAAAGAKAVDNGGRSRIMRHVIVYFASLSGREFYPADFAAE